MATVVSIRTTPVHLTEGEIAEMQALIDQGELPKSALKDHFEAEARNVYGFDAKKDRHGNYIQQGVGAKGRESANHFASIRRYEGKEAWEAAVKEIWKRDPKRAKQLGLTEIK